jgi:hypothetical protein
MIYDSISNYAISVNLGHFTGFFTGKKQNFCLKKQQLFILLTSIILLFQKIDFMTPNIPVD